MPKKNKARTRAAKPPRNSRPPQSVEPEQKTAKQTPLPQIEKARAAACEFLQKTLNITDVTIIKAAKAGEGWDIEAEVYEESSFIKALGLSTRVRDRNNYVLRLNAGMEVESYERKNQAPAQ